MFEITERMKRLILVALLLLPYFIDVQAQDFIDNALLFSRTQQTGSARIQAIGGAQVALGGDYSSALSNPAGLGLYNRNEFTFSPAINILNSESEYFGEKTTESKQPFYVPGLSMVLNNPSNREKGFLGGSFAITMTRTNDFQQVYSYGADVPGISIIDYFIENAGTIDPNEMLVGSNGAMGSYFKSLTALGYNNYLIEEMVDDNGNVTGYNSILNFSQSRQTESSVRTGGQYQWSFAYGANFADKLFVGANVGIGIVNYSLEQTYEEKDFVFDPGFNPINNFVAIEEFDINGTGFNATLGAIYRVLDFLQVGASYATPTKYSLRDKYFASMTSDWNDPSETYYEDFRDPDVLKYKLKTPAKLRTGLAYINKRGFISADVEFANYSKASYSGNEDEYDYAGTNEDIKAEIQNVINLSIGGELRLKQYRIRAGYNLMQDPYVQFSADPNPLDRSISAYSGGVGYRAQKFFVDLTGVFSSTEGKRIPYFLDNAPDPVAIQKFDSFKVIATFGYSF